MNSYHTGNIKNVTLKRRKPPGINAKSKKIIYHNIDLTQLLLLFSGYFNG